MSNQLLDAIIHKLEGEIAMAKANIQIYLDNPAGIGEHSDLAETCLLYTSPSPRDGLLSRMPSSA